MVDLGVTSQRYIFEKNLCYEIARVGGCPTILRNAVSSLGQFILDVMADQGAEFQIAFSSNFRKVVFPNKQILMILPRRLMPKSRISIRTPVGWQAHARLLREDRRKLGSDIIVESLACFIRRNLNVVSGARELELVNRRRTQGRRQLDGETVAGLIPIRADGREAGIAPEVSRGSPVRPGFVCILDQQTHLLADVD